MTRTEWTSVLRLRALVHLPDEVPDRLPGVVLVDGSGPGSCDDWGGWPERLADLGAVVLTHDRAGCGGSPGSWIDQSLDDRAVEERAAIEVLRAHPAVTGPVGLIGVSQGGWVSMLAAADADFLVSLSGPGVGPAAQERHRIEVDLRAAGRPDEQVAAALDWIDERARRLRAGEDPASVLAVQQRHADQPWYEPATRYFDTADMVGYMARLIDFEPAAVLPGVRCPALALFGAADPLVPVPAAVAGWIAGAPRLEGLAVFPGADHGLFVADPEPGVERTSQLAPGFLPMLGGFLRSVG
jgi:pimeloyl-ACP methyl ester carboxylesterase